MRRSTAALAAVLVVTLLTAPAGAATLEPEAIEARRCASLLAPWPQSPVVAEPVANVFAAAFDDERLRGAGLGLSVWIDGLGVREVNPTLRLRPASNQKLLTAVAAFEVLGPDHRFVTEVRAATVDRGTVEGDLYLVGGGDPFLAAEGDHSLDDLARMVRSAGVALVTGDVVVDETRYDTRRRATGWSEAVAPAWVGSLSALLVDQNRHRADATFLADPAPANAALFAEALRRAGVVVAGTGRSGSAPAEATTLASLRSPTVADLVAEMLTESDNTIAEILVKEIGFLAERTGSTAAGMRVLNRVAEDFCLPETVLQLDGSGLSHGNARSAGAWRRLLQVATIKPWFPDFVAALPVAGETGTLRFRFRSTAAEGNLRAKTGTITGIRALSGYLTTASGRRVVFSAIVDADEPRPAMAAVDGLLAELAAIDR